MNRVTQNLLLPLLGGAVLRISAFSTAYLNYVKPGFRPFLIGAGAVLAVLGVAGLLHALRGDASSAGAHDRSSGGPSDGLHGGPDGPGHDHSHGGPRVA